jgi:hypothetical protein
MLLMLNKIHKSHFNGLSLYVGFTLNYDPTKRHCPNQRDWDVFEMHYKTAFYRHTH